MPETNSELDKTWGQRHDFKRHFGRTASEETQWVRRHLGEAITMREASTATADDPFDTFNEWNSGADQKAYRDL